MTERLSECLIYAHSFPYVDDNCAEEESMQALGGGESSTTLINTYQLQLVSLHTNIITPFCILIS